MKSWVVKIWLCQNIQYIHKKGKGESWQNAIKIIFTNCGYGFKNNILSQVSSLEDKKIFMLPEIEETMEDFYDINWLLDMLFPIHIESIDWVIDTGICTNLTEIC